MDEGVPTDTSGMERRHIGALDGLRAVAVLAVMLFHGGVSWAKGGFLGVEAFFVLSGFLITSLLVSEWERSGTISLSSFWARRARRLLPALLVVVVACVLYERAVGPSGGVSDFGADVLSTLLYVANWHQIWTGSNYFAAVGPVSPLQHTWSLAIEEQFYLLWPLVVLALLRCRRPLRWLLGVSVVGAAASALEMAVVFHDAGGVNRAYYGTDTRAQGLLVGAALASVLAMARRRRRAEPGRIGAHSGLIVAVAGVLGAGGLAMGVIGVDGTSSFLYDGGFLAVDLAVVAVIMTSVSAWQGRSPLRSVLESRPLRALGTISYGVYLWHLPLFLWLTSSSTGVSGPLLLLVRVAATLVAATLSFFLVEQPVRQRRLRGVALRSAMSLGTVLAVASVSIAWTVGDAEAAPTLALNSLSPEGWAAVPPPPGSPPVVAGRTCVARLAGMRTPQRFDHCPVVSALLVGDSIGLTLGMQVGFSDNRYGVSVDDAAQLGCGFVTSGDADVNGTGYGPISPVCLHVAASWRQAERRDHPGAVVVEMGYWEEAQWLQGGRVVHLGEPGFDAEVRTRIVSLVETLSLPHTPIVLLSVPWVRPPPWPDGSPPPQASAARHELINSMLASVAAEFPGRVHYFDVSPYVTPGNQYDAVVAGEPCRMPDGIHFYVGQPGALTQTRCGASLQAALLPYLRRLILASGP